MNSRVHHAENTLILNNAQYLKEHGKECIIYTTAEPWLMCLGTIVMSGIRNIVIGTEDPHMHTGASNRIEGIYIRNIDKGRAR